MPLSARDKLGPYEILAPIGAGGMGEVYKARDTRLNRIVAIKVSKEQFSERFEQEARAVAALNHPHICQLYDVGPNYLVMEFVEGAPLKGPLPIEKTVEYAAQILDALDAAHQKGITHRDLKPANILVTKQGIKLLDFGLAKQAVRLSENDATKALTDQGQIVGTLQYMSPEQLQGKEVDARSDLFSFGCVLYELLTGKRAFDGTSAASVIAAILEREPAPLEIAQTAGPGGETISRKRPRPAVPNCPRSQSRAARGRWNNRRSSRCHRQSGTVLVWLGGWCCADGVGRSGWPLLARNAAGRSSADAAERRSRAGRGGGSVHYTAISPDGSRLVFPSRVRTASKCSPRDC